MAREKPLANVPCPRARTCLPPFAGWMRSVPLAIEGVSAGKWCARAPSSARLSAESRLGSFGNRGNGRYREELRKARASIGSYLTTYQFPQERTLLRLDGQYGTGAVLADLVGFADVSRGKDYTVLDHHLVQARLHLPPDQTQQRPERQVGRSLYDCPAVPVGSEGVFCRVVVATHRADKKKSPIGVTREGVVYELFFSNLPQRGFTACDVVKLYLLSFAFEPQLADEDAEQDPDRWCSHSAWGQEAWAIGKQPEEFKAYRAATSAVEQAHKEAQRVIEGMRSDDRYNWLRDLTVEGINTALKAIIPGSGAALAVPLVKTAEDAAAKLTQEQVGQLVTHLRNRLKQRADDFLVPDLRLGFALGEDLARFARNAPLLFFFGTYEEADEGDALLRLVMAAAGLRVGWIIAG